VLKRIFLSFGWLVLFTAAGALLAPLLVRLAMHQPAFNRKLLTAGAEIGLNAFIIAFCFAWLPGARRRPGSPQPYGLPQGIWGMAGFGAMLVAGSLAVYNVLFIEGLLLTALHRAGRVDFTGATTLTAVVLAGELSAAIWISWFARRLGAARLQDGSPAGIAWRPAAPRGYAAAAACAAVIIVLVLLLYYVAPPNLAAMKDLPMAKLFQGPAWSLLPLLLLVVLLAPVLEELVFRGIAFGGIAVRFGPGWASLVTTLLFMAVHAQEKIHYLPGFIDVGLMAAAACWLRVKFASIRPGILLHILYNGGLMLASGLAH